MQNKTNGIYTEDTENAERTEKKEGGRCLTIGEGGNKLGACGNSCNDCFKWIS